MHLICDFSITWFIFIYLFYVFIKNIFIGISIEMLLYFLSVWIENCEMNFILQEERITAYENFGRGGVEINWFTSFGWWYEYKRVK